MRISSLSTVYEMIVMPARAVRTGWGQVGFIA
jgi:hypothetical protein